MLSFFLKDNHIFAVRHQITFNKGEESALTWLFSGATLSDSKQLEGYFIGPRAEMITPWSTNATEITEIMGIAQRCGIDRIELFVKAEKETQYDQMLLRKYSSLNESTLDPTLHKEELIEILDLRTYNEAEGLALSQEEILYLEQVAKELGRPLTDAEVFGFSQVNSEHCRHKIFGGTFVIDGEEKEKSLFQMIKETSKANPNNLVSAYKDNVAFNKGPEVEFFTPHKAETSSLFTTRKEKSVLSLKAETHNFPTTVEPFNGAATGTGGEIRDRLAGGKASIPIAGTAVYMTPYPRVQQKENRWEQKVEARPWLYQTPQEILIKASNGASDFGNKFGQPLICGSLLTFEHLENDKTWGYDKVIMLAGGVGYTAEKYALKGKASPEDHIVVLGGDNYRIGMGGGAVSSVNTGHFQDALELNAIQRSNPEMQKRASNVIRALAESEKNPIISIHDHGAGGHLNCLSELVEETGGTIYMEKLPLGDPTLSDKELISNESQERMGLLLKEKDLEWVQQIAERERAPFYTVGKATDKGELAFIHTESHQKKPFDLKLTHLFGSAPKTVITDKTTHNTFKEINVTEDPETLLDSIKAVLRLEAVGSKDWLTNKVDRSVTGKIARQQCLGELQLPLSDLGAVALDYTGTVGMATSIGHAPQVAMANAPAGSRIAIAEALTNIIGAPLKDGLKSISLSANWMWPCKNEGEDARLYTAVKAAADFAIALGINIPTGKDSLSMTQKYGNGEKILAPGTLIVSALGEVSDVTKIVSPVLKDSEEESYLLHLDCSGTPPALGGSAYLQTKGLIGNTTPDIASPELFKKTFNAIQALIADLQVLALHDISSGGIITTLLEMTFANTKGGLSLTKEYTTPSVLFSENPGVILQVKSLKKATEILADFEITPKIIAKTTQRRSLEINGMHLNIDELREEWYTPSKALEPYQTNPEKAAERAKNIFLQPLKYNIPHSFNGKRPTPQEKPSGIVAAIIRDKGTNGEREMAYALHLAGFEVKDVHMTDLMSGREDLSGVQMIVFCGGFSHSDVLGSAKGWAAGFKFNHKAEKALLDFYARPNTLSLGVCNGCQLMAELGILYADPKESHKMLHNESGRFESSFVTLKIPENNSIMLHSLAGYQLGCWIAHGEGRFKLSASKEQYNIVARYLYDEYPGNPNGSDDNIAALASSDGRHLAIMPHPERCIFSWQCAFFPFQEYEMTPWFEAFVNAFNWCKEH